MRILKLIAATLMLGIPVGVWAQSSLLSLGVWNLTALSGELKVGGLYGGGDINTYGINNHYNSTDYYGGILIKTSSFIWNPAFLKIDIDGGYYPESRQDLYLVTPNIYNAINTSKLHLGATLFPKKVITLSGHLDFNNSYDNRENLTDIRTESKSYGGNLSYRNNFAPITLEYNQNDWNSREVLTNRIFTYKQKNVIGRLTKSFGKSDKNDLIYTHNDYYNENYGLYTIRNVADNLELQDGLFLDSSRRSLFNSDIFGTIQKGNDSLKQLRANEKFIYKLPYNLQFNAGYNYGYLEQLPEKLQQNDLNCMLGHQLFESLHSGLIYEYNDALETSYHELSNKGGLDLNYNKKTFADGMLSLQYSYFRIADHRTSSDALLQVNNEQYTISDRVILKSPYIDISTVVIKDATGTTIYQPGIDYILTSIGSLTEIQRIPGGLIQNNSSIYVYYAATQPGSYSYNINQNNLYANWSVFNHLLDFYYRGNRTDYDHLNRTDALILDELTDDLLGTSVKYKSATLGAEYDNYQSTLTPYTMWHYFFTMQDKWKSRVIFALNANWRDYKLPTEAEHRQYGDINGMASYAVSSQSKFDLNIGYQSQRGEQISLDLLSARAKYSTVIRKLNFVFGVDSYNRVYIHNQATNYAGAYIQIIKKFKY